MAVPANDWFSDLTQNDRAAWGGISTATREYVLPQVEKQLNYHDPVLEYLIQNAPELSTHELTFPVEFQTAHGLGTWGMDDTWTKATWQDPHTRAKFEWAYASGQIQILAEEIDWNKGPLAVFNIVSQKTRMYVQSLRKMMSYHLMWATGGGTEGTAWTDPDDSDANWGNNIRAIGGLAALFGGSWSTTTYTEPTDGATDWGGIDGSDSDYAWWRPYVNTTAYAMTPATLLKLKMNVKRYGLPNIYVTSDAAWEAFWNSQEVRLNYDQKGYKPLVDAGFTDAFMFQGVPFVYSDWCVGSTNDNYTASSSHLMALNKNNLFLDFVGGRKQIKLDPFLEEPDSTWRYAKLRNQWQLCSNFRRSQGLMTGITDYA